MFRSILVPLDGSDFAERALGPAIEIAGRTRATLRLLRVVDSTGTAPGLAQTLARDVLRDALVSDAGRYLERVADGLRARSRVPVTTEVSDAKPADAILATAATFPADLVVMTTHARTGVQRFFLGSVASEVVRRAFIPVLLHRGAERGGLAGAHPPRALRPVVLVPLDGSRLAESIVPYARTLSIALDAGLALIAVARPIPATAYAAGGPYVVEAGARAAEDERAENEVYLRAVARRLRDEGVALPIELRSVIHESPAAAIIDAAAEAGAAVIAMATRGRGSSRLALGSVAERVLARADADLLVLRPPIE